MSWLGRTGEAWLLATESDPGPGKHIRAELGCQGKCAEYAQKHYQMPTIRAHLGSKEQSLCKICTIGAALGVLIAAEGKSAERSWFSRFWRTTFARTKLRDTVRRSAFAVRNLDPTSDLSATKRTRAKINAVLTESSKQRYAHQRSTNASNRNNHNVIRISQLLLSLIASLLLIGVGLIGFGKRPGLAAV